MIKTKKIKKRILILGSSLEALRAANLLADNGYEVVVAERDSRTYAETNKLHGIKLDYISNAQFYGFDYLNQIIEDSYKNKKITILSNAELLGIRGKICNYEGVFRIDESSVSIKADSIIFVPTLEAEQKDQKSSENILYLSAFAEALRNSKSEDFKQNIPANIAFYLTEEALSRLNFSYVMDYADFCSKNFAVNVTVITPDILTSAMWMETKYRKLRESGVVFMKYQSSPKIIQLDSGKIEITLNDSGEASETLLTELLVISEKNAWSEYSKRIAEILDFAEYNNTHFLSCKTSRKGIFICGKGREDILGYEAFGDANECFVEISDLFPKGVYSYETGVVEINKNKCTLCLTCVRTCPHKAIEFDGVELEERAVKIVEEACFRCGLCVSDCPTKALSFSDY